MNSYNGPLRTVQSIALEVIRGRVEGAIPFGAAGEFVASGGEVNHVVWPNGTFKFPGSSGASIEILSDNVADTLAGAGAQKLEIDYLDTNLNPQSVIVNTNGTTVVTTDENGDTLPTMRFIQDVEVIQSGTFGSGAVGTITVRALGGGDTYGEISAGYTVQTSSAKMVPAGKRAIVYGLSGASISLTADANTVSKLASTQFGGNLYNDAGLFFPIGSTGFQNNSFGFSLPVPVAFTEGAIIAITTSPNKAATITGDWFGWLEDV